MRRRVHPQLLPRRPCVLSPRRAPDRQRSSPRQPHTLPWPPSHSDEHTHGAQHAHQDVVTGAQLQGQPDSCKDGRHPPSTALDLMMRNRRGDSRFAKCTEMWCALPGRSIQWLPNKQHCHPDCSNHSSIVALRWQQHKATLPGPCVGDCGPCELSRREGAGHQEERPQLRGIHPRALGQLRKGNRQWIPASQARQLRDQSVCIQTSRTWKRNSGCRCVLEV